jgi:hypothetical protein
VPSRPSDTELKPPRSSTMGVRSSMGTSGLLRRALMSRGPRGQVRGGRAPRRPAGRLGQRQGGARGIGTDQREHFDTPGPACRETGRQSVRGRGGERGSRVLARPGHLYLLVAGLPQMCPVPGPREDSSARYSLNGPVEEGTRGAVAERARSAQRPGPRRRTRRIGRSQRGQLVSSSQRREPSAAVRDRTDDGAACARPGARGQSRVNVPSPVRS